MSNNLFPQPICEQIWNGKYRLTTPNEQIDNDMSVKDTWYRIASACAGYNKDMDGLNYESLRQTTTDEFYAALEDFKFLPAGRITAGAGSGRNVTLFNCYVMGTVPDSMGGIFDMLKEAALTMQQGGGIGYDFTPLRPTGSLVKGVDADASGPLSFMDVWDAMCRTIMSAGSRRGAMMATMRCDHPDIEQFITAKHDSGRLRMFNLSVLATDQFMSAVRNNSSWNLMHPVPKYADQEAVNPIDTKGVPQYIYKTVQARDLWNLMMKSTYDQAEPGVLFIDRINKMNNLWDQETISATNPCGEQPLPPYGACLLGSINLAKMVKDPFSMGARITFDTLEKTARTAVRMLDAVIDISNFPIPQQQAEAYDKRRMGLGITGLADMLLMMGYKYGAQDAADLAEKVMQTITLAAYRESISLARELGPCPALDTKEKRIKFVQSGFLQQPWIPSELRDQIIIYGIRNALLTSIAPTGTISLYAGNVSSGVEPIFATNYTRKVLEDDGVTRREELVEDYAMDLWRDYRESNGMDTDALPEALVTAQTLTPKDHLVMQAAVQKWVDSSISKTINCPEDISFEDFEAIYLEAYASGLKGCTTYRPNDVTGSVLSVEPDEKEEGPTNAEPVESPLGPLPRAQILDGQTYKLKWENKNFYVTINNQMVNGKVIPFEIFINTQDMTNFQWILALTRMMSSVFRRGGDVSFVIEDLKTIMDPKGGAFMDGKYIASFIALLGQTVEQHLHSLEPYDETQQELYEGYAQNDDQAVNAARPEHVTMAVVAPIQCTECSGFNVQLSGGCPVCGDCGHSKCG